MSLCFLAASVADAAEPVVKWLTIAIACAAVVVGLVLFFARRSVFAKYVKYALLALVVYAFVIGVFMLSANIAKHTSGEYLEENGLDGSVNTLMFVPLLIALIVTFACAVTLFTLSVKRVDGKLFKKIAIVCGVVCAAAVIAAASTIAVYFSRNIKENDYYYDYGKLNQVALYIGAAGLSLVAIGGALILGHKDKKPFDSHCIALAGICVALSFALSYIKLFAMPQGGSVTLASLLPIMLFAYIYGAKKGVLVGVVFGLMQAIQDPWILHPGQFLLDYPIAFAMVGFAGAFKNLTALDKLPQVKFALGATVAVSLRFFCHLLSGVYAFGAYALDKGYTDFWLYSAGYNSFVFIDLLLVIVVGVLLFSSKAFNRELTRYSDRGARTGATSRGGEDDAANDSGEEAVKDVDAS